MQRDSAASQPRNLPRRQVRQDTDALMYMYQGVDRNARSGDLHTLAASPDLMN